MIFAMKPHLVETRREAIIAKRSELPHVIVDTDRLISDQRFDGSFVSGSRPFQRGNYLYKGKRCEFDFWRHSRLLVYLVLFCFNPL